MIFGSLLTAQEGDLLFQDPLNADTSTNWTIVADAPLHTSSDDWAATFAWDYSPFGIQASPNAVDGITKGLRLQVNLTSNQRHAITLTPNGQNFTGNYVVKFDLWMNFNGTLGPTMPAGGNGSTEYATFGVGTDNQTVHQWSPLSSATGVGGWFSMDGDGGSGLDYRAFSNATSLIANVEDSPYFARTSELYDPDAGDPRRWSQPYYHEIMPGGVTAPTEQIEMYWDSYGETAKGVSGFMWHEVKIEVIDGTVTWYLDNLPMVKLTPANAGEFPTDGNIFIGYADPFDSLADYDSDLSFALYSNLRVFSLPFGAAGFATWASENIADENARGPLDNPAGDGINNLLKYALGLDPAVADRSGLPIGVFEDDGGTKYLTLTASKNPDATDVELLVEVSGDLATWNSGSGHTTVLVDDGTTLKVRDNTALSAAGRRYIRLNASLVE